MTYASLCLLMRSMRSSLLQFYELSAPPYTSEPNGNDLSTEPLPQQPLLKSWIASISFQGKRRDPMTKSELKRFRALQTAGVAELERLTRDCDGIAIDRSSDDRNLYRDFKPQRDARATL